VLLVYASKTGNVERFAQKIDSMPHFKIASGDEAITEPCVLLTYTTGIGQVPLEVSKFVEQNKHLICGVAASGNRNWGETYGKAAQTLNQQYGFPILHTFELSGTRRDAATFLERVQQVSSPASFV
jgi:protein involved in ribonucleotide reduction